MAWLFLTMELLLLMEIVSLGTIVFFILLPVLQVVKRLLVTDCTFQQVLRLQVKANMETPFPLLPIQLLSVPRQVIVCLQECQLRLRKQTTRSGMSEMENDSNIGF